jgi:hypothetical protein
MHNFERCATDLTTFRSRTSTSDFNNKSSLNLNHLWLPEIRKTIHTDLRAQCPSFDQLLFHKHVKQQYLLMPGAATKQSSKFNQTHARSLPLSLFFSLDDPKIVLSDPAIVVETYLSASASR